VLHCCAEFHCKKDEYKCLKVPMCIPYEKKYDGVNDCPDGSDETGQGQSAVDQHWFLQSFSCSL